MLSSQPFSKKALHPVDRMIIHDLLVLGGYEENDPLVDVLVNLFATLEAGSVSIDLTPIGNSENPAGPPSANNSAIVDRFLPQCQKGAYDAIVAWAPDIDKPLVLVERDKNYRLYFQKYYYHESRLKRHLKAFTREPAEPLVTNAEQFIQQLYRPERALRKGPEKSPLYRDTHQVAAIRQVMRSPLTIISGGPGTGKTTVMVNLLRCLADCGVTPDRILVTAPTGRAARRMTETLKQLLLSISKPTPQEIALHAVSGQTVHAALGYRHPGQFRYTSINPLPKDVVIVDEASMVDVILMSQFISALDPTTTRLALLGDPDQLPAVAAGSIFARLMPFDQDTARGAAYRVVLDKGYRSGSELSRLGRQVRRGLFPDHQPEMVEAAFSNKPFKPWCRLASADLRQWPAALKAWARFYQTAFHQTSRKALNHLRQKSITAFSHPDESLLENAAKLWASATMARILTLIRKGPWGCEDINDFLKPLLANSLDQGGHPATGLYAGMPVMITRNDSENGLYNGDVGVVVALKEGYYALFQPTGRYVAISMGHLTAWEPAMAITVHKSQGSEYKQVFLVLPDDPSHRLLSREMVYTAVTRAQKRLVIWGDAKTLHQAVSHKVTEGVDPLFD